MLDTNGSFFNFSNIAIKKFNDSKYLTFKSFIAFIYNWFDSHFGLPSNTPLLFLTFLSTSTKILCSSSTTASTATAAASADVIPEHILNQFSEQMKRLEENHAFEKRETLERFKMDVSAMKRQHQQEIHVLKQELDKAKRVVIQSQQDVTRNNDMTKQRIDKLEKELEQSKQIVRDHEKEFKRLQEQHLQQLRGMEKQVFQKEDESMGNVERVKLLEVRKREGIKEK